MSFYSDESVPQTDTPVNDHLHSTTNGHVGTNQQVFKRLSMGNFSEENPFENAPPVDEENPFYNDPPTIPSAPPTDSGAADGTRPQPSPPISSAAEQPNKGDILKILTAGIEERRSDQQKLRTFAYDSVPQIIKLSEIERSRILSTLESAGAGVRWVREFRSTLPKQKSANAQQSDKPKTADYIAALSRLGYTFRRNLLDDSIESGEIMLDDYHDAIIANQMNDLGFNKVDRIRRVVLQMAQENSYHPIREYLDGLTWDGKDHIKDLADKIKDAHAPIAYTRLDSDNKSIPVMITDENGQEIQLKRTVIHAFLRRFLVGMVAKMFQQTQNIVLVFTGGQGKGKSSLVRWLAGPMRSKYHREGKLDPDSNDHLRSLARTWLWELGEISAITRKGDVNALKNILTQESATYRAPYGRWEVTKTTSTSFVGTVNPDGVGFLRDLTGNRRFACVDIESINWKYTTLDIEQIHAQAYHLYRQGEPWLLSSDEAATRDENNKHHEVERLIDDCMETLFVITNDMEMSINPIDIAMELREFGYDNNIKTCSMDAATWMKKQGLSKRGKPATWRGLRFRTANDPATIRGSTNEVREGVRESAPGVREPSGQGVKEGVREPPAQMQLSDLPNLPNHKKSY